MLIKEVLTLAAEELGRADFVPLIEQAYADAAAGTAPEGEAAALLSCYHLVENEVALDHFPLKAQERFLPAENAVLFTRFSRAPVDVLEVTSAAGRCAFSVVAERLILPEGTGEVTVLYSYAPERAGMDGETAFSQKISARLLSYGVAREYLLAGGRYAEAAVWDEKFHAALRAAGLERRKLWLRARRWA